MAHVKVGVVVVSAAVTAAVALYRSPEMQRHADAVRRRLAQVLHQIGDNLSPPSRQRQMHQPFFNRPEDAYAYWEANGQSVPQDGNQFNDADEESRRRQREEIMHWNATHGPQVDADEESRRRQCDEIMYWNAMRERQAAAAQEQSTQEHQQSARGTTSFDDFLSHDRSAAETGAYVFNSGADWAQHQQHGLVHRRAGAVWADTMPSSNTAPTYTAPAPTDTAPTYPAHTGSTNPFASYESQPATTPTVHGDVNPTTTTRDASAAASDDQTDIYNLSVYGLDAHVHEHPESLVGPRASEATPTTAQPTTTEPSATPESYTTADSFMANDPFSDVQAWARNAQPHFYSPLPETPRAPSVVSEFDTSAGQATPTDSVSVIGSDDVQGPRPFDVLSESEGIPTPASWSEVGSVVSDEEH